MSPSITPALDMAVTHQRGVVPHQLRHRFGQLPAATHCSRSGRRKPIAVRIEHHFQTGVVLLGQLRSSRLCYSRRRPDLDLSWLYIRNDAVVKRLLPRLLCLAVFEPNCASPVIAQQCRSPIYPCSPSVAQPPRPAFGPRRAAESSAVGCDVVPSDDAASPHDSR